MTRTGNEPESAECRRGVVHGVCVYTSKAMVVVRYATCNQSAMGEIKIHGERQKGSRGSTKGADAGKIQERSSRCRDAWGQRRRVLVGYRSIAVAGERTRDSLGRLAV